MIVRLRRAGGTAADGHRDAVPPWVRTSRTQPRASRSPPPDGRGSDGRDAPMCAVGAWRGPASTTAGAWRRAAGRRPAALRDPAMPGREPPWKGATSRRPGDPGPSPDRAPPPQRGRAAYRHLRSGASQGRQGVAPATTTKGVAATPGGEQRSRRIVRRTTTRPHGLHHGGEGWHEERVEGKVPPSRRRGGRTLGRGRPSRGRHGRCHGIDVAR